VGKSVVMAGRFRPMRGLLRKAVFCGGAEGDGEAGIFGCVGCEETDFAEVFSADATDGIEDEVLVGLVS